MAIVTIPAGEAISTGNAVSVLPNGLAYPASAAALATAKVVGLALTSCDAGFSVQLETDSLFNSYPLTLTPGDTLFLSVTSGSVVNYSDFYTTASSYPSSGVYLVQIGRALSPSGISIEIENPKLINNPIT